MHHDDDGTDDWVEVRRYDDSMEAGVALDFLRDHGVRVALRGNSGSTGVLTRFVTVLDIRLVVPPSELPAATEALAALYAPDAALEDDLDAEPAPGAPAYRGSRADRGAPERDEAGDVQVHRSRAAGFFLGLLVPIGGGHFYARHGTMGSVFCGAILGCFLGGMAGDLRWLSLTAVLLVLADALGSTLAVGRYESRRVPTQGRQMAYAFAAVASCAVAAYALARVVPEPRGSHPQPALAR